MKYYIQLFYFIYLIIIGLSFSNTLPDRNHNGLYDEKSGIIALDKGNIYNYLNYSSNPWIVVFYAHWCGHCVQFVDVYSGLRKETTNWNIYVGAINCASNDNELVCANDFKVDFFPKVMFFPCNEPLDSKFYVKFSDLFPKRTIHTLRQASANFIMNQTKCSLSVKRFPVFNISFWNDYKTKNTVYQVMIILIGSNNHIGIYNSIILDLAGCNRFIVSMIDIKNVNLTSLFGSYDKPSIIGVTNDMKIDILSQTIDDYADFRSQLHSKYSHLCSSLAAIKPYIDSGISNKNEDDGVSNNGPRPEISDDIHITDIISGIGMSLRDEIPRADLTKEYIGYVRNWVETLYDCVPWPQLQRDFLHNLMQWMYSQGDNLNSSEWRSFFKSSTAITAFPTEKTWITCKGKTPMYRGYPCSLWLTFHVMAVSCEHPSRTFEKTSPDVLVAAKGFIVNFFGCGTCREHFREMSKNVLKEVKNSQDAILWLWSRHNVVNARIRYDDSADPTAPKVQYPTIEKCPECYDLSGLNESSIFNSIAAYDVPKNRWNINSLLTFLRYHYGAGNIRVHPIKYEANNTDLYDPAVVSYPLKLIVLTSAVFVIFILLITFQFIKPRIFRRLLRNILKLRKY